MNPLTAKPFSFADFELDGVKRLLFKRGKLVILNSKTFDLLLVLVEHRGEVLSKDELLEKVWAGQFVEEGNLTVQISALRRIFGEKKNDHRFIVTVPGRGYSFVAEFNDESEIIVESHSLSKIIIEEEIEETNGQPAALKKIAASERKQNWFERLTQNRLAAAVFGLILVASVVGGYLWQRSLISKNSVPFKQMSIRRLTSVGNISNARLSPDGKLYAYVTTKNGQRTLWLGHVDGGEPRQLRPRPIFVISV